MSIEKAIAGLPVPLHQVRHATTQRERGISIPARLIDS